MIEVIHYKNKDYETPFEADILESLDEVRKLLPNLPKKIKIYFSDYGILEGTGLGGFAYSKDIITISLDPDFPDKDTQRSDIKPTIFHEAFHLSQNFTAQAGPFSAIQNTIYEGMATVFEREHAGSLPPYGDYRGIPDKKIKQWLEELRNIDAEEFDQEEIYSKWKFYHPEHQERWIAYRAGTWLVDQVLAHHHLKILDLRPKKASDVLDLYNKIG